MTTPSEQTVKTWVGLVRAYKSALSTIESALKNAGFPALSWYDVLLELDRAGAAGLRPFELQEKLLLPQYGVSRLIARIETAGYLECVSCEDDKRGQHLIITKAGKKLRKQMWRVYANALQDVIGNRYTSNEASQLSDLLDAVIQMKSGTPT